MRDFWEWYQTQSVKTEVDVPHMGGNVLPILSYKVLGLVGELAEFDEADNLQDKEAEIGDVLWYLSTLLVTMDASFDDLYPCSDMNFIQAGCKLGNVTKKIYRDNSGTLTQEVKVKLLRLLSCVFYGLGGPAALESSARYNIDKLFSRLERGTLHGDGDNR